MVVWFNLIKLSRNNPLKTKESGILMDAGLFRLRPRDAAKKIGISHPTLGSVFCGGKPSFKIVVNLASFLHVPIKKSITRKRITSRI